MKYLKHPWAFLLLSVVMTVVVKVPHLGLPYFFDETSSYIPAIMEMAKEGPSLMPGSIPLFYSKGHPLLFYFLASSWMKFIAGDSLVIMRLFPLLVSLAALVVFHHFAKRHTNLLLANIGVLLLSLQPMFLAQASLVLPEILLFMLFILSFDRYLSRSFGGYALFGSLMMLTKESAAVFAGLLGLAYLAENYRDWNTKLFWKDLLLVSTPVGTYLVFLLLHHLQFGVFLYQEHLNYISFDRATLLYKFNSATSTLLLAHGRNVLVFAAIISLAILLFKKEKIAYSRFLVLTMAMIIAYLAFCIFNFFTYRYLFPVMGITLLASLAVIQQIKIKYQALNVACIACMLSVSAYYSTTKRGHGDADLGYTEYLVVHQQVVSYCEKQGWYDKKICAGFNILWDMHKPYAHYLSTPRIFKVHALPAIGNSDLIIYDSTCSPGELVEKEKNKLILVKRMVYKSHWAEIYRLSDIQSTQIN
ncbi:MAG TPA: hypothetical protein VFG54_18175 [Prolixibacteraceae bacterium]|nr:hypothetical protein [Prolixibacteraceae bacterium]